MKIRKSFINVLGELWYPSTGATVYNLSDYDLENMKDDNGNYTRESVELWLGSHSGDFQSVTDFSADLSLPDGKDIVIPFENEENEMEFNDIMYAEPD